jgi:ribosomal protein S11
MLEAFVRGRLYKTSRKPKKKKKSFTIKGFTRIKNKVNKILANSVNYIPKVIVKKRKEHSRDSYFRRYFYPKGRPLYKRTVLFKANRPVNCQAEETNLIELRPEIKRQEFYKLLNTKWGHYSYYKPLSERTFSFGRIYITYRRRNTFITINKLYQRHLSSRERVVFKTSCGLIDYKGPKRTTLHAKLEVAKKASAFLTKNHFTSVDIVFCSGIARIFKRVIRALNEKEIYVRYLIISRRRSHGFLRKKKKRRL